ncbi:hypothetical protein FNH08_10470 [Streptomyces spongiae]|uniref:Uncharacterized protein n=1 Tax=Streptomyces spongiae TaxID=565072 RepID=A0A5N8XDP8_9ACTN|nr:hypothetical protein [Streptomyces spongiae]
MSPPARGRRPRDGSATGPECPGTGWVNGGSPRRLGGYLRQIKGVDEGVGRLRDGPEGVRERAAGPDLTAGSARSPHGPWHASGADRATA